MGTTWEGTSNLLNPGFRSQKEEIQSLNFYDEKTFGIGETRNENVINTYERTMGEFTHAKNPYQQETDEEFAARLQQELNMEYDEKFALKLNEEEAAEFGRNFKNLNKDNKTNGEKLAELNEEETAAKFGIAKNDKDTDFSYNNVD